MPSPRLLQHLALRRQPHQVSRALHARLHAATAPSTGPVPRRCYASKDAPGKDDLNPTSTEYSKSGGDNAAAHSDEAFDPSSTRPETETAGAGADGEGASPLDVSPGNPEVNRTKRAENTASGKSAGEAGDASSTRAATSGRGSPKKSG